jgi:hypothetical protein
MLTPAPIAVARPAKNANLGVWVAIATEKIGARDESEPSIKPLSAGCARWRMKLLFAALERPTSGEAISRALAVWPVMPTASP